MATCSDILIFRKCHSHLRAFSDQIAQDDILHIGNNEAFDKQLSIKSVPSQTRITSAACNSNYWENTVKMINDYIMDSLDTGN